MLALFVKVPTMQRLRKIRSFLRIPNILRITVRFRTSPLITYVNILYSKCNLIADTRFVIVNIYRKMAIRGPSSCILKLVERRQGTKCYYIIMLALFVKVSMM